MILFLHARLDTTPIEDVEMSLVTPILNFKIFFSLARREQIYKNECAKTYNKCKDKLNCKVGEEALHYFAYSLHASLPPILFGPNKPSGLHPGPRVSSAVHQTNLNSPLHFLLHPGLTAKLTCSDNPLWPG